MKTLKSLIAAVICAALLGTSPAFAAAPTLDGSASNTTMSGVLTGTVTLTTANANDDIVCVVGNASASGSSTASVSSITSAGLTFVRRTQQTVVSGTLPANFEIWWAPSSLALTAKALLITMSGTGYDDAAAVCFGVNGTISIGSPWDVNTSLPYVTVNTSTGTNVVMPTFSTCGLADFVFWATFVSNTNNRVVPTGSFTTILNVTNTGGTKFATISTAGHGFTAQQTGVTPTLVANTNQAIALVDAMTADGGGCGGVARHKIFMQ